MGTIDPAAAATLDERLSAFARTGEATALEAVLTGCAERAHAQAMRLLGNAADADDAVQEAFLQLVRTRARYDGSIPASAWIGRLVHDAALMAARARGRRRRREEAAMREQRRSAAESTIDPETVRAAVAELGEADRRAISLFHFAELSQEDAASALGITAVALRVRLHRARERLRRLLVRRGIGAPPEAALGALAPLFAAPDLSASIGRLTRAVADGAPLPASPISLSTMHKAILAMKTHPLLTAAATLAIVIGAAVPVAAAQVASAHAPADTLSVSWSAIGPRGQSYGSQPILAGNRVLLCGRQEMAAVDPASGATAWTAKTDLPMSLPGTTPKSVITIIGDAVAALDLDDGHQLWRTDLVERHLMHPMIGSLGDVAIDGTRTIVSALRLVALDTGTGAIAWTSPGTDSLWGSPVIAGDSVLCADSKGLSCFALDNGAQRWRLPLELTCISAPAVANGVAYVSVATGPRPTDPGTLVAIDAARGAELWRVRVPDHLLENPALVGDAIAVSGSAAIHAYARSDGSLRWRYERERALHTSQCLTADDSGLVWAGGWSGQLLGLDARTGQVSSRIELEPLGAAAHAPTMTIGYDQKGRLQWTNGETSACNDNAFPGDRPQAPRATLGLASPPAVDGDRLYVLTASGWAVALKRGR